MATNGSNFNTGLSWSSPKSDLQATLHTAVSGDQVWVAKGTYTGNFTVTAAISVYGGFAGTETSIAQRDIPNNPTVLDGTGSGTGYDIQSSATGTTTLDGLTIQDSNQGLVNETSSPLSVANCTFSRNNGGPYYGQVGGAIQAGNGATTILNSTFSANGGQSGAVYTSGIADISDCSFTDNSRTAIAANGQTSITNCSFTGNSASDGGAIYVSGPNSTITGCQFIANTASSTGGAVHVEANLTTISHSSFINNVAPNGAAICGGNNYHNGQFAQVIVSQCNFSGNSPGCISFSNLNQVTSGTPSIVKDCLIMGLGTGSGNGDGIDITSSTAYVSISNNVIVNTKDAVNMSSSTGAVKLGNNIFYANSGGVNDTGTVTLVKSNNDFFNNGSFNYQGVNPDPSDIVLNPAFVNATGSDYHILPNSPDVAAGNDSYVGVGDVDLDGRPRIGGAHVSIGCYELPLTLYVSPTGSDSNNGHSWQTALQTLQHAIDTSGTDDSIWVAAGTYSGNFTSKDRVSMYGGFAGTETTLAQRNIASNPTILDGNNAATVLTIPSTALGPNTLNGFTFQHGAGTIVEGLSNGGGVYDASGDDLTLANCVFTNNSVTNSGGGLDVTGITSITNSTFSNNTATNGGGALNADAVTIANTVFTSNSTANGPGGAIQAAGALVVGGSTFTGNSAGNSTGGGITDNSGSINVSTSTFRNNVASLGGGIDTENSRAVNIHGCIFSGGSDAINLVSGGTTSAYCLIKDNLVTGSGSTAGMPNGIDVSGTSYAAIVNNTIVGTDIGINCTAASGNVKAANNIFDANFGGLHYSGAAHFVSSHNDNYANASYNYQGVATDTTDLAVNPLFVNVSGGNFHLGGSSTLIDAGNDNYVGVGELDLDGHTRNQGAHVDLGAFELTPAGPPPAPTFAVRAFAVGRDDQTHIIWDRLADHFISFWNENDLNGQYTLANFGPFSDYQAVDTAVGPDNHSHILWTSPTNGVVYWNIDPASPNSYTYSYFAPISGWVPSRITVGPDSTGYLLWNHPSDGAAVIWTITNGGHTVAYYPPISGWTAKAIGIGPDNHLRLLWSKGDGSTVIWKFDSSGNHTLLYFGPISNWTSKDLSVDGNNRAHVLYSKTDGSTVLWTVNADGSLSTNYYAPITGWTPIRIASAPDGFTRVLWASVNGQASVWRVNDATGANTYHLFGPF